MKALIYRTSDFDGVSSEAPVLMAQPIDVTDRFEWLLDDEDTTINAWVIEIDALTELVSLIKETGHELIISTPEYKINVGQDIDIEIYDNYRE